MMPAKKKADDDEDWGGVAVKQAPDLGTRLAELKAKAPVKREKERFVKLPLWWAAQAAKATRTPKSLVVAELLWASWDKQSTAFALPSGRLRRLGLSRTTVWRTLQQLKRAGLIVVELRGQKAPLVSFPVAPWARSERAY
jgi:HTH domain